MRLKKLPRISKIIIVTFCVTSLILPAVSDSEAYLAKGEYAQALASLQSAWKEDPESVAVREKITNCRLLLDADRLYQSGNYEKALVIYKSLEKAESFPHEKLLNSEKIIGIKGEINKAFSDQNYQKALDLYDEILKLNPADQELVREKEKITTILSGKETQYLYINNGEWQKAYEYSQKIWSENPGDKQIETLIKNLELVLKGRAELKNGNYLAAVENYSQALLFFENNSYLKKELEEAQTIRKSEYEGDRDFTKGLLTEAIFKYRKAYLLNQGNSSLGMKYKKALRVAQNFEKGKKALQRGSFSLARDYFKQNKFLVPNNKENNELLLICEHILAKQQEGDPRFSLQNLSALTDHTQLKALVYNSLENKALKHEIEVAREIIVARENGLKAFENSDYLTAQEEFFKILKYNQQDQNALLYYQKSKLAQQYKENILAAVTGGQTEQAKEYFKELRRLNPQELSSDYRLHVI